MGFSSPGDPNISKYLGELLNVYRASQSWYWRIMGLLVALAMVVSAVFQVLDYLNH